MTEVPDIKVLINEFRAVEHADIIINGITLVAGENGSGKSSVSKLLYYLYKTVSNYELVVRKILRSNLKDIFRLIELMNQEVRLYERRELKDGFRRNFQELVRDLNQFGDLEEDMEKWLHLFSLVADSFMTTINERANTTYRRERVEHIIKDILSLSSNNIGIQESFERIKEKIKSHFANATTTIDFRPTSVFINELEEIFSDGALPQNFEVLEYGAPIVSLENEALSIPYNIQNSIYIDSPMMFHSEISDNVHWDDLTELLTRTGISNERNPVSDIISQQIIDGDVSKDETEFMYDGFQFQRSDGSVFNLRDVATGIKSFSMLLLLLKNGSITDKTLMIIDEPESNLHPQWVIEYARIIVLLNKKIGTKFFLASHNPDMVSAIRYISEKEGTLDKVNFYLAEASENKYKYNYKHLGKEIDPIFESFNIALERINRYGI